MAFWCLLVCDLSALKMVSLIFLVKVDLDFVNRVIALDDKVRTKLMSELQILTELENPNSVVQLKGWLSEQGVETESLDKKSVKELVKVTKGEVSKALALRMQLSKSSIKKYQAMKDKKIDVMVIFTTDGQLAISDVVVLEDDKKMYPSYRAGTVVRSEILSKYPELKAVLEKLNNILDDKTMADLNYQVESEGKKPEDVAREYLQEKGLLEVKQ